MDAQSKLYTPEQYGWGKAKIIVALQETEKRYKLFKLVSAIHPNCRKRGWERCWKN